MLHLTLPGTNTSATWHHNKKLVAKLTNDWPAGGSHAGKVGDGGASWRLKALARAKTQAGDASDPNFGRKIGDIVSEQWGSLSELTAGLQNARAAHGEYCVFFALHCNALHEKISVMLLSALGIVTN